jgi:predicted Zn-dependent protease
MAAYARFTAVDPDSDQSLDFLSSHPNAPQRVELARLHARAFGAEGAIGDRGRDYYLAGIDGLLYGDAPEEGYVRGQTFLHGKLGIRFDVPAGFQIDNKADAVLATGPGDVAIRFDGVADSRKQDLVNYISSGWVTGLRPETIQPVMINGLEAATAKAAADRWQFDVTVVRIDNQIYRFLTAVPMGSKALEPTAAILKASFRKLTPAEVTSLKPLRIRVVTARAGDTVASLAGRMMGTDRKLDLFRLINAMTAASTVRTGEKFKIISE